MCAINLFMWCTRSYFKKLIKILRNSNIWCRYGNNYTGVYCSADDLSLLSPTYTGLQEMLKSVNGMLMTMILFLIL